MPRLRRTPRIRHERGWRDDDATHASLHDVGMRNELLAERTTHSIIGAFYEVYNTLGYGFLEHVYVLALELELRARGHRVAREVGVTVRYKGTELAQQRMDMVVDDVVVVEVKATEVLPPTAKRQAINYLKGTRLQVGLILHFGPEPGFHRAISTRKS